MCCYQIMRTLYIGTHNDRERSSILVFSEKNKYINKYTLYLYEIFFKISWYKICYYSILYNSFIDIEFSIHAVHTYTLLTYLRMIVASETGHFKVHNKAACVYRYTQNTLYLRIQIINKPNWEWAGGDRHNSKCNGLEGSDFANVCCSYPITLYL